SPNEPPGPTFLAGLLFVGQAVKSLNQQTCCSGRLTTTPPLRRHRLSRIGRALKLDRLPTELIASANEPRPCRLAAGKARQVFVFDGQCQFDADLIEQYFDLGGHGPTSFCVIFGSDSERNSRADEYKVS